MVAMRSQLFELTMHLGFGRPNVLYPQNPMRFIPNFHYKAIKAQSRRLWRLPRGGSDYLSISEIDQTFRINQRTKALF
jgi:hypothetical protein